MGRRCRRDEKTHGEQFDLEQIFGEFLARIARGEQVHSVDTVRPRKEDGASAAEIIRHADAAMYVAKENKFGFAFAQQNIFFCVRQRTDRKGDLPYFARMLHEFLTENRQLLIARCKEKVAKRFEPSQVAASIEHGVPLFLEQLVETLKSELTTTARGNGESEPTPAPTAIGRAAALHGAELLRSGFTVDQVVHDYGDVCQAVTALAVEQASAISVDEFRTLNRCLDNAIADAVASFGDARQASLDRKSQTAKNSLADHTADQRRLVAIAIQSFTAIKTGNIGPGGATGDLLEHTLTELLALADRLDASPAH